MVRLEVNRRWTPHLALMPVPSVYRAAAAARETISGWRDPSCCEVKLKCLPVMHV